MIKESKEVIILKARTVVASRGGAYNQGGGT